MKRLMQCLWMMRGGKPKNFVQYGQYGSGTVGHLPWMPQWVRICQAGGSLTFLCQVLSSA